MNDPKYTSNPIRRRVDISNIEKQKIDDNYSSKAKQFGSVGFVRKLLILGFCFALYMLTHIKTTHPPIENKHSSTSIPLPSSNFKDVTSAQTVPYPRKMSETENDIYFIHIPKTGGTSVDSLMNEIVVIGDRKKKNKRKKKYRGGEHYDWSWVLERGNPDINADVISFLRDPVARASSHFHFSKNLPWAKKGSHSFVHQSFEEYLENPSFMDPLIDGLGGVEFLAGTASPSSTWIKSNTRNEKERSYLRRNMTANALQAAHNLDRTVYFGLLEDIPRSMKLLQISLDLDQPPKFPKKNNNKQNKKKQKEEISPEVISKIEPYMPGDIWLYKYAKLLFEARYNYATGKSKDYIHPELPPIPPEGLRAEK